MALIYTYYGQDQDLAAGESANIGGIVRRQDITYAVSGGNLIIRKAPGMHLLTVNATFALAANGIASISLYKDGILIPGATTSATGVANAELPLTLADIPVRESCCEESVITVVVSAAGTMSNITMTARSL